MLHVFITLGTYDYEGSSVLGIASTLEDAKKLADRKDNSGFDIYRVEEHTQDERVASYVFRPDDAALGWVKRENYWKR